MIHSRLAVAGDRIIEPMLDLARSSNLNRISVAGANSAALMFELHRRGYVRVATTANCGLPCRAVRRGAGRLAGTLDQGARRDARLAFGFLSPAGGLVVWVDPQEPTANRELRAMLEKHGLIVEAGTVREHGSAVLAQRSDMKAMPKVA
jgi:hypothetical protein